MPPEPGFGPSRAAAGSRGGGGLLPFLLFGELRLLRALARSSSIAAAISGLSSPLYQTRSSSPGAIGCGERRDRRRANQSDGCWRGGAGGRCSQPGRRRPARQEELLRLGGRGPGDAGRDPLLEGGPHFPAASSPESVRWMSGSDRIALNLKLPYVPESYCWKPHNYTRRRKNKPRNHNVH